MITYTRKMVDLPSIKWKIEQVSKSLAQAKDMYEKAKCQLGDAMCPSEARHAMFSVYNLAQVVGSLESEKDKLVSTLQAESKLNEISLAEGNDVNY